MARILVVDDQADARYLVAAMLGSSRHEVFEAANGEEALNIAQRRKPELVISDVMMPVMDGFELCSQLRKDPQLANVGFIFYSANYTLADERNFAKSLGCDAYLEKPNDLDRLVETVESVLQGQSIRTDGRTDGLTSDEFWPQHRSIVLRKLQEKLCEVEQANAALRSSAERQRQALSATVVAIDRLVEYRDPYTAGHQHRVGQLAAAIGRELGLESGHVEGLLIGGYLHDVGKVFAPAEILTRPTKLSKVEFDIVKMHAAIGHDILKGLEFPWPVAQMALQHHERLDGTGYPAGLKGEDILLEARIIAVADVVEAMGNHRPYRPALGLDAALSEIEAGSGKIYDSSTVNACLRLFRDHGYRLTSANPETADTALS